MGSFRKRASKRERSRRRKVNWPTYQLSLFCVLLSIFILVRIYSIYSFVTPKVCNQIESLTLGSPNSAFDGPLDLAFWIGCLGLVIVLVLAASGLAANRQGEKPAIALGACNIGLALGLIAYSSLHWAFYYPERPGAEAILRLAGHTLANRRPAQLDEPLNRVGIDQTWMTARYGWTKRSGTEFVHETGAKAEFKQTQSCFTGEFRKLRIERLGFAPVVPGEPDWQSYEYKRSEWVFYDPEGRMMMHPEGTYFKIDPDFYEELQEARKNPSPFPVRDYVVEFETRYHADQLAQPGNTP